MIKSVKKYLVALLSVCFCVCVCAATLLSSKVSADGTFELENVAINVVESAYVKTKDPMGIKFRAVIGKADYDALNENYDSVQYGILIAPKDYVKDADMVVGGWQVDGVNVLEYPGEETAVLGTKYFQNAIINPVIDTENPNQYYFEGSFVGILEANYDREFSVTAYAMVSNDGGTPQYVYSNKYARSVYSVSAGAIESGDFASDAAVTAYMQSVLGYVNNAVGVDNFALEMTNITNAGQAAVQNDVVSFSMNFTNDYGYTIKSVPVLSDYGTNLVDNGNGTYTVNTPYKFTFNAEIDGLFDSNTEDDIGPVSKKITKSFTIGTLEAPEVATFYNDATSTFFLTTGDANIATATAPDGTNAFAFTNVNTGGADTLSFGGQKGADKAALLEGKYFSFKYYNTGVAWGYNESRDMELHSNFTTDDSYSGKVTINQYTQYGDAWVVGENLNEWITVEVKIDKLGNSAPTQNRIHFDTANSTLYLKDFKVSDCSFTTYYKDLTIQVSGGSGENGEFIYEDEIVITATSNVRGEVEPVPVDASLLNVTATDNAVAKVGGKYIYQGTGDFELTASIWGVSDAVECTGKVALKKTLLTQSDLTKNIDSTTIETVSGEKSPQGNDVYSITFADHTTNKNDKNYVAFNKSKLYAGSYLTLAYYHVGELWGIVNYENYVHSNSDLGNKGVRVMENADYGNCTIKHFAQDSTIIIGKTDATGYNRDSYKNCWNYIEIYFPSVPTSDITIFMNEWSSIFDIKIADITVTNYSLLDYYTDLNVEVSGGTGAGGAFVKDDKVAIAVTSTNVVGESVPVPVEMLKIEYSTGALTLDSNGDYIYNGNGDFNLTASMFGLTKTVSNIKGIVNIVYEDLTGSFVTLDGDATITKAVVPENDTSSTLYKAVSTKPISDQDVYVYHSEATQAANAMWLGGKGSANTVKGKYLIFSFYNCYAANFYNGFQYYELNVKNHNGNYVNDDYMGKFTMKFYNQSGQIVSVYENPDNGNTARNQWITVEMYIETLATSTGRFHLQSKDGKDMYITGVRVSDAPLYPSAS